MDNGDNLNNVFLVKKEYDEINEDHQLSQFKREDMYAMCQVNREGYKSDKETYNQNPRKLEKAFNKTELVKLMKEQYLKEIMHV